MERIYLFLSRLASIHSWSSGGEGGENNFKLKKAQKTKILRPLGKKKKRELSSNHVVLLIKIVFGDDDKVEH